jgi:hypothetical protein
MLHASGAVFTVVWKRKFMSMHAVRLLDTKMIFLLEVNNVQDQLEDIEFMYVYGEQWVKYRKRAVEKFEEDEESRDNSMDELHGCAKMDADLHAFDDSDCLSLVQSPSPKNAKGDSPAAASFAAAGHVEID